MVIKINSNYKENKETKKLVKYIIENNCDIKYCFICIKDLAIRNETKSIAIREICNFALKKIKNSD